MAYRPSSDFRLHSVYYSPLHSQHLLPSLLSASKPQDLPVIHLTDSRIPKFIQHILSKPFHLFWQTSPSLAVFSSFFGSVIFGSNAACSSLAAPSSVPLFEYSVASVLMLSLSWLSFRGNLERGVWENGRSVRIEGGDGRNRRDWRAVRRRIEAGDMFEVLWSFSLCLKIRGTKYF